MSNGVLHINPDVKSGSLTDGTEFVSAPGDINSPCTGCLGNTDGELCLDFPECGRYNEQGTRTETWIFVRKE